MSKKSGLGKFLLGMGVGAGLALLFAPQSGKETRQMLKNKIDFLVKKVKEIEPEDVKEKALTLMEDIRNGIRDLDKEKVKEVIEEKSVAILLKADELVTLAVEKGTPIFERGAKDIRRKTSIVLKDMANRIEPKETKKLADKKTTTTKTVKKTPKAKNK